MTTLQKSLFTVTFALAVGTDFYQARQASNQLEALAESILKLKGNSTELLKLRSEVARLRAAASQASDPYMQTALQWKANREI